MKFKNKKIGSKVKHFSSECVKEELKQVNEGGMNDE